MSNLALLLAAVAAFALRAAELWLVPGPEPDVRIVD